MNNVILAYNTNITVDGGMIHATETFLSTIRRDLSINTHKTYSKHLKSFTAWFSASEIHGNIKEHLQSYRAHLKATYKSGKSINLMLSVVRSFYTWMFDQDMIDSNPTASLKNVKVGEGNSRSALDKYQLNDLLVNISNATSRVEKRNQIIISLAIANGLRINEISNINIEDIQNNSGNNIIMLKRKGYDSKDNFTILTPKTFSILKDFIGCRTEGVLFTNDKTGGVLSADTIGRTIKRALIDSGIDGKQYTAHSLRHTFAVLAYESGATVHDIMIAMNHKNISTTQTYLHSIDRFKNSAEKRINIDFGGVV